MSSLQVNRGFTLIELTIVLVIIGLLVGGVLVGRDLIRAAEVRATITQLERYQTAVNTFRGKYGQLPGDISNPDAASFGFAARGKYMGEGDGDGFLYGTDLPTSSAGAQAYDVDTGENAMFWADLSAAHFIEGSFTTASSTVQPGSNNTVLPATLTASYMPQARLGGGNYIFTYSQIGYSTRMTANYFSLQGVQNIVVGAGVNGALSLTVQSAAAIDTKIDDGLPITGRVQAIYWNTVNNQAYAGQTQFWIFFNQTSAVPRTVSTCFDNNNSAGATLQYSILQSNGQGVNCALSFQFQ